MNRLKLIRKSGMVLLEAMLAVVLVSVSLVIIVQAYLTSYRGRTQGADFTRAWILLENQMTEIFFEREGKVSSGLSEEKNFLLPFEKFHSQWQTEKLFLTGADLNLLKLKVSWPAGAKEKTFQVTTLVSEPSHE